MPRANAQLSQKYTWKKGGYKVGVLKVYDAIDWNTILNTLKVLKFSNKFEYYIESCITAVRYLVNINGSYTCFFKRAKGFRQGDPILPFLFVIVMEIFNKILHKKVFFERFKYHWIFFKEKITHLCFVDDLFLFAHGDIKYILYLNARF